MAYAEVILFVNKWNLSVERGPYRMRPQLTLETQQDETPLYAPPSLARHNHHFQLAPAESAPSVLADWNPWQARLLSGSNVLPEQFFNPQASFLTGHPIAALLRAVLEDALTCFQKQFQTEGRRVQREAREAEEWFLSTEEDWPFSFESICTVLGLAPEAVRQQLKCWRHSAEKGLSPVSPPSCSSVRTTLGDRSRK